MKLNVNRFPFRIFIALMLVGTGRVGFADEKVRTWADATGKHKIRASFVGIDNDTVRLMRVDGKTISLPEMLQWLKRHPFPVEAYFDHCLVLTYALPAEVLQGLLPPSLKVDRYGDADELGFLAIAMVQTKSLRPAGLPEWLGQNFFLSGYRVFARFRTTQGRTLRGLRILRSDTDRLLMMAAGNILTHYNYRPAKVYLDQRGERLDISITTPRREADLSVVADISDGAAMLPEDSPFRTLGEARRFAGPLPYTFDDEPETGSIIVIKATRRVWKPRPVYVNVRKVSFLDCAPFRDTHPVLASAFYVHGIPYRWERGVRYSVSEAA